MRSFRCVAVLLFVSVASPGLARVWTDDTGQQQAEAEFVSIDGDVAMFRLPNGEARRCEFERLSTEDQSLLAARALVGVFDALKTDAPASAASPAVAPVPVRQTSLRTAAQTSSVEACAGTCAPQTYECTVMVPEWVTEMRTVTVCEWRSEERQATYTVCRMVPETREVSYQYTVPTYETRMREFIYSVFKPVVSTHERAYTVMVPHVEKRQGTRRECHLVPVEMTRTVCEDHGGWQQIVRTSGCSCCCSHTWVCNVWVPKYEQREVKYTVMRPEMHEVPYEYNVTVCKPEQRTETVQVCNYVSEQQKRSVPYTVCVPVTKTATREVTSYRRVAEQKTRNYTVRVPYPVQKEVPVKVCRMVAKKVTMPVTPCGPSACWRGGCCW